MVVTGIYCFSIWVAETDRPVLFCAYIILEHIFFSLLYAGKRVPPASCGLIAFHRIFLRRFPSVEFPDDIGIVIAAPGVSVLFVQYESDCSVRVVVYAVLHTGRHRFFCRGFVNQGVLVVLDLQEIVIVKAFQRPVRAAYHYTQSLYWPFS